MGNLGRNDPYSEEDIINSINEAAYVKGEPLTFASYREFRKESEKDHPSEQPIYKKFTSWKEACTNSGVQSGTKGENKQYSKKELSITIKNAVQEIGEPLTQSKYQQWRKNNNSDPPTVRTIERYFGSWQDGLDFANVQSGGSDNEH
jgi:hypothetical protein